ncbi:F-box protein SKIP14-like isoform X2 [Aristolochia californica]|uniref:F-box protein SKIP14-like isoform X2 n=1 Tax=Aristolochia californica TaxID=171875 RepID=UPI0035DE60DA
MTLNLPACSVLQANPTEEELISSALLNCVEKNVDSFARPWRYNWEVEESYDWGGDICDRGNSREPITNDILDLLPPDPFDMDLGATFTALAGWFEDLETTSEGSVCDEDWAFKEDYQFLAGFNFLWNTALMFGSEQVERLDGRSEEKELGDGSFDGGVVSVWDIEEILGFEEEDKLAGSLQTETLKEHSENYCGGDGKTPHDALEFVMNYLDLQELLIVERVCKTMKDWVRSDNSLWSNIHVDQPLSERLTDDALVRVTGRANRNLKCLSLVHCPGITDKGLRAVLQYNPKLTKLSVPGCTRLNIEGLVNNLKAFNSSSVPGIKWLRIGELYGITHQHFTELKLLLGADSNDEQQAKVYQKPRLYPFRHSSVCVDGGFGAIDIEVCPRCGNPKILYDCPVEGCQASNLQTCVKLRRNCMLYIQVKSIRMFLLNGLAIVGVSVEEFLTTKTSNSEARM